jgi:type 2 lantibiotic biosynthesis protein LanM
MIDWTWHKSTTLAERMRWRRSAPPESLSVELNHERGRKRFAKWKAQPPFDSGGLFQQRLEQAGLTESNLLEFLSDGTGGAPPPAEPPGWALEIARALSDGREENLSFYAADKNPENSLLELIRPLVEQAAKKLREGIKTLAESQSIVPFDPETGARLCLGLLPGRLLPVLVRTMVLELNVARLQGLLQGENGEERFACFIRRIRQPEVRLEIFREYPVMVRLAATILERWVTSSLEFLKRCCMDWSLIREAFSPAQDPGLLVEIQGNAGDCHRGGRTVWILEFHSGLKVVYKPKPMAVDQHFQELLGWLNERDVTVPFHQLVILDRGNYGWEEFVSPQGCSSRDEVARFYRRTGGYVALLFGLAATDFHHENILAAGEHPVLIDLEALFHPSGLEPAPQLASEFAARSFGESVLGSGLLPVPVWGGREAGAFDLSGLGAEAGQKIAMRAPGWNGKGTDEMHFARQAQVIHSSDHRPKLNGVVTTPLDYLDEIETGFQQVYRLLEKHRSELLARGGLIERFAEDEVRVVLRNSSCYADLLQEGSHPDVLRDGLDRDRLFDRLWEEVSDRPRLAQLIPAEVEDLWQGDIPLFTTKPGSRDLCASADRRFPDVLNESGLDRARQRLEQFGAEDLKRQLWFLRGSLTTLASATRPPSRSRRQQLAGPGVKLDQEQLLRASCAVGDRLADTALHGAKDVSWIGLNLVGQTQWILVPLGLDLYDGVPGVALFLGYLGAISEKERYTTLARAALETVRRRVDPDKRKKGFGEIGGFVGWGGLIYTLAHLGVLWGDTALLAEAREWVEALPERIGKDKDLDIIGGAAGCIMGLLGLHSCDPSARVLEVSRQCGEHLLSHARQMPQGLGWAPSFATHAPLTGFSHGAAGISLALLELSAQTGDERFRTAALSGIAYERSLFSNQAGNWPDLRVLEKEGTPGFAETPSFLVAWCHGAPGIALARLLCRRLHDDPLFEAEIETGLRATMATGFGHNHSLCHGDLGNLELIQEAARTWPGSSWGTEAERVAADILSSINSGGWLCGNPLAVESPGLMTGLAGIGYGLLRCAEPARVPSVLSLAPPVPATVSTAKTVTARCQTTPV